MNGIDFLADTNALIYLLKGRPCMTPYLKKRIAVSVITFMELLSYADITAEEDTVIRALLDECELAPINDEVMEQTIHLRRTRRIKLPDAIIAATAMVNDLPLLTADTGFDVINGLRVEKLMP